MPPNFAASRGQRDQFLGGGVGRRRVLQRSGEAHGALAHGVADQRLHALQFRRGGRAVVVAEHHAAHLRGAHVAGQVDPHALLSQAREVLAEGPPGGLDAVVLVGHAVRLAATASFSGAMEPPSPVISVVMPW